MDKKVPTTRIASIDQFRGFAIVTMVLANYMGGVSIIPAWLKHAPDVGLTVIDFIAPFFIFAISLTYGVSFRRRMERDGGRATYQHFLIRFLAILGLGAIISAGETFVGENPSGIDWGVLQAIGMAGLVTLVVIRLPSIYRWMIGAGLLILYEFLLDRFWLDIVVRSPHGGLFGALDWSAMMILGTALADLFYEQGSKRRLFPLASALILLVGLGAIFLSPVSKHRVSASYVLITLGSSAVLFLLFHWLTQRFQLRIKFLEVWGRNPLVLYFLHYVIIGIFFLPNLPMLYASATPGVVLLEMVVLLGGVSAVAYWMDRKNVVITL